MDWTALALTIKLAVVTTALLLLVCLPLAWWLARTQRRTATLVEAMVGLPLVLPPTVLGFYLLVLLGPHGAIGGAWESLGGDRLVFSFPGLVIGSMLFSLPFVVQPLQAGFAAIPGRQLEVAATLRAKPLDCFFSIILPQAARSIVIAAMLGFAHTLGEFGVVLMLGGSIPGRTKVISIAIYDAVEGGNLPLAQRMSALMLLFSFLLLIVIYGLNRRSRSAQP